MSAEETEARLRGALASRADSVEPRTGTEVVPALAARADAARRRSQHQRVLLSVAAVTVVVAGLALGLALAGGDRDDLDVAGTTTSLDGTTSTAGASLPLDPVFDGPAIWPLTTMSITYASPAAAAEGFWSGYLGQPIRGRCEQPTTIDGIRAVVELCLVEGQEVFLRDEGVRGWVVVGAETTVFDLASPAAGSTHAGRFPIGLSSTIAVELVIRPVGSLSVLATGEYGPGDVDAELGPEDEAPGAYVVTASTDDGATVRVADLAPPAPTTSTTAAPTTTSTTQPTTTTTLGDTGTIGWPGGDDAPFPDPTTGAREAALAFADDVLGFADSTVAEGGPGMLVRSRPTAGVITNIGVHFTGARGWVVTGATSAQGTIEAVQGRTLRGTATAFEGTLTVRLLALDGTVLDETFTQAGSNGEQGPFEVELGVDRPAGPHFVLIGESDASGEGDLSWAAVTLLGT